MDSTATRPSLLFLTLEYLLGSSSKPDYCICWCHVGDFTDGDKMASKMDDYETAILLSENHSYNDWKVHQLESNRGIYVMAKQAIVLSGKTMNLSYIK